MSIVQLFNREQKARAEFANAIKTTCSPGATPSFPYALFYPAVEILSIFAIALIYWAGGNRVLASTLSLGVLTIFTMFATRFFRPIQDLSEKFNILQSAMAASERIFKLLDEPALTSRRQPTPFASTILAATSNSATCGSAIAPFPIPAKTIGSSATCPSASSPAKRSPSSVTPAPARPRSSLFSFASTTFSAAKSFSTASTSAKSISRTCAASSASSSRIRFSSPARSNPTSASALRASTAPPSRPPSRNRSRRLHRVATRRRRRQRQRAWLHALRWPAPAHQLRPRPGAQSALPHPRRSHLQRGHQDRAANPRSPRPPAERPHRAGHRASSQHHSARRPHPRLPQGPPARTRRAPGACSLNAASTTASTNSSTKNRNSTYPIDLPASGLQTDARLPLPLPASD